jgi:hypothetical protein
MPLHKQVTECRHGGPVNKTCSCEHCSLDVCSVCGAGEGALTTDCPGRKVSLDQQLEVCQTRLDYTDARGWHQAEPTARRTPRFSEDEKAASTAPTDLKDELVKRAIAWAEADRIANDHSAVLTRIEDELDAAKLRDGSAPSTLLTRLLSERMCFEVADQHAQERDEEFRQVARKLEALESK